MVAPDAQVHLSITPASDPISGVLTGPDGKSREFSGWLELSAAIEAARSIGEAPAAARLTHEERSRAGAGS
jgi:hypothetical protein